MKSIGLFFGSSSGNTEYIASKIKLKLNGYDVSLHDVSTAKKSDVDKYEKMIFGISTWGIGDLQEDWEVFMEELANYDFSGKTIAIYGLGDQDAYPESFVDGIGIIFEYFKVRGANFIGSWPVEGYDFEFSKAVIDNKFVGLPLDEDSQPDLTEWRLDKWIQLIKKELV